MKTNLKKLTKSQIEIDFELDEKEFAKYTDKALEYLKKHIKMDGFRPGNVPKDIAEKQIGNENLLMETGDLAVKESYSKFVNENNMEPIDKPEVQILKIAKGSPFLFKVKVAVLPEIELPDYKKIASQIIRQSAEKEISVEPQEVEDALKYLQKSRAKFLQINRPAEKEDFVEIEYQNENINKGQNIKDGFILGQGGFMKDFEDNLVEMKAGEEKEFTAKFPENHPDKNLAGKETKFKVKIVSVQKMELPEINDEFAKSLGAFDNLVALKENLKEEIIIEKQEGEKQRKRGEVLSKISEKIRFDIPTTMVEYEQERLLEDFKNQITQNFKINFQDYLISVKKTEDEIKKSFEMEAEKRIKNFLVLRAIGKTENIKVSQEEIEVEVNKIIKQKPFDSAQGKFDINQLKDYTKSTIFNEKVFQFLDQLGNKNSTAH